MNIIKSIAVLFFLVFVVWVAIRMICNCYYAYKLNSLSGIKVVSSVSVLIITFLLCLNLYEYTYPFERKIPFEHVETIELSEDYALSYPGSIFWHSSYPFERKLPFAIRSKSFLQRT